MFPYMTLKPAGDASNSSAVALSWAVVGWDVVSLERCGRVKGDYLELIDVGEEDGAEAILLCLRDTKLFNFLPAESWHSD